MRFVQILSAALFAVPTVFAQGSQTLHVQIPFGFHVGNSSLPAGEYIVNASPSGVLKMQSFVSGASAAIPTHRVQKFILSKEGRLVFNRYGKEYFLSQVWKPGLDYGSELGKSRREYEDTLRARRGTEILTASR